MSTFDNKTRWSKPFSIVWMLMILISVCYTLERKDLTGKTDFPRFLYKSFPVLTNETFDETIKAAGLNGQLVFFGAKWCGHSRQFNRTFKELGEVVMRGDLGRSPKLSYYLIQNPKDDFLHRKFRVNGFPTLVFMSYPQYWTYNGERELPRILDWLEEIFASEGKEGTPYPEGEGDTSIWHEMAEIWRDMKYTLRYNLKHYPLYTWLGIVVVCGSVGSVLFIFGILIYDTLILSGNIQEEEI